MPRRYRTAGDGATPPVQFQKKVQLLAFIAGRGLVLENHAVAIDGGKIVEVLPGDVAARRYRGRAVVHLARHAVTPGFVNAHTHAAMTLLRGVGDDLPLMRWLTQRIWPLEKALVSPEFVYDGSRLAAVEMLRSGTTCARSVRG